MNQDISASSQSSSSTNPSVGVRIKNLLIKFSAAILLLLVVIITLFVWIQNKPSMRFGANRSSVITQIQTLNRFETTSFTIDRIIEVKTNHTGIKQFLFGDRLILIAEGTVIAGVDLSNLSAHNFIGVGKNITVNLPAPEIFSVQLHNNGTKVFDRDTGLLTKGEIDLEAQARQEAASTIKKAACEGGILNTATEQAKKQMEIILRAAGFETITINVELAKHCGDDE
jgi:hypothetical protein